MDSSQGKSVDKLPLENIITLSRHPISCSFLPRCHDIIPPPEPWGPRYPKDIMVIFRFSVELIPNIFFNKNSASYYYRVNEKSV